MNECPLVSVLIPCYNHEAFLGDCLCSLLAQDYENMELLICDDCSPDDSFGVIQSFESRLQGRFPRSVILRNESNFGVTKNINRMLEMARGEYVKILASDDAMTPNAIGAMVSYLQQHPEMDVVVANGVKVSQTQHYPDFSGDEKIYTAAPDFSPQGFFARVARCNEISAPAAMVRRSVYTKYGNYDEQVKVEDYEFWLRILKDGNCRFGFLDEDLLFYRISDNSMTSLVGNAGLAERRKRIFDSQLHTLNQYRNYLEKAEYAEIVLTRIFEERWLAVEYHLTDWEAELWVQWKQFSGWADLPAGKRLRFRLYSGRQRIKKCLYRQKFAAKDRN